MSKRTKSDYAFLKKQRPINPDWNKDLKNVDYKIIDFSIRKNGELYDEVFNFLYESKYYYSKILDYIDITQKEYGYLVPIPYGLVAKTLDITTEEVSNAIHRMRRKGVLFEHENCIMRIRCIGRKNKIFKRMLRRHPFVTLKKPLGYSEKK